MQRTRFRIIVFCLLGAGLVVMIVSMFAVDAKTRDLLLSLTGGMYLAAAIQIVVFRTRPRLFNDKHPRRDENIKEPNSDE